MDSSRDHGGYIVVARHFLAALAERSPQALGNRKMGRGQGPVEIDESDTEGIHVGNPAERPERPSGRPAIAVLAGFARLFTPVCF